MIRTYKFSDLKTIDYIGNQIKPNFVNEYDIDKIELYEWLNLLVYEENDKVVGFIEFANNVGNIDIYTIAIDENFKRHGIATKLIDYVKENYNYETITLEVRSKNDSAIKLYKKNNFEVINIRKKYYENDDAYVMQYKNSKGSI